MATKKIISMFFSAVTIVSCEQKSDTEDFTYTLVPSDSLIINIDNTTKPYHSLIGSYNHDKNEYIYFAESNRIDFYNLNNRKLEKRILIPAGGPDGLNGVEYARYISNDTILVKSHDPLHLYQYNSKGKK